MIYRELRAHMHTEIYYTDWLPPEYYRLDKQIDDVLDRMWMLENPEMNGGIGFEIHSAIYSL